MTTSTDYRVAGFTFSALASGIKKKDELDLGLICANSAVDAAAVFTSNKVQAAPVVLSQQHLRDGRAQCVLVNSGNANACTGAAGLRAAKQSASTLASAAGCKASDVVVASTGVIGAPFPEETVSAAIPSLYETRSASGAQAFASAIMTTDRWSKIAAREVQLGEERVRVLGIAKGAGMIHPNMATTLGFVMTDAKLTAAILRQTLRKATDASFNTVTVDGDTSTNDMILVMASGEAMKQPVTQSGRLAREFEGALRGVLLELAESIVRDGEGAEHCVTIVARGLPSVAACRQVASKVATSLLVKTAFHGCDPNWGRLLMADGNAGVPFDANKVSLDIDGVSLVKGGLGLGVDAEARAAAAMKQDRYTVTLTFGSSQHEATYLTSDIGHEYVRINADYRS